MIMMCEREKIHLRVWIEVNCIVSSILCMFDSTFHLPNNILSSF